MSRRKKLPYQPRTLSLVALGLTPPAVLGLEALRAFVDLADPFLGLLVAVGPLVAAFALLGWAALRLQRPLDEEVSWGSYRRLLADWARFAGSLVWRVGLTFLVFSLPVLGAKLAGVSEGDPGWTRPLAVLAALGIGWWTFVYFWVFPVSAVRREASRKDSLKEAWALSLRHWPWPALFVGWSAVWAGIGPAAGPAAAWQTFLTSAAWLLVALGQVLWLLSRPTPPPHRPD